MSASPYRRPEVPGAYVTRGSQNRFSACCSAVWAGLTWRNILKTAAILLVSTELSLSIFFNAAIKRALIAFMVTYVSEDYAGGSKGISAVALTSALGFSSFNVLSCISWGFIAGGITFGLQKKEEHQVSNCAVGVCLGLVGVTFAIGSAAPGVGLLAHYGTGILSWLDLKGAWAASAVSWAGQFLLYWMKTLNEAILIAPILKVFWETRKTGQLTELLTGGMPRKVFLNLFVRLLAGGVVRYFRFGAMMTEAIQLAQDDKTPSSLAAGLGLGFSGPLGMMMFLMINGFGDFRKTKGFFLPPNSGSTTGPVAEGPNRFVKACAVAVSALVAIAIPLSTAGFAIGKRDDYKMSAGTQAVFWLAFTAGGYMTWNELRVFHYKSAQGLKALFGVFCCCRSWHGKAPQLRAASRTTSHGVDAQAPSLQQFPPPGVGGTGLRAGEVVVQVSGGGVRSPDLLTLDPVAREVAAPVSVPAPAPAPVQTGDSLPVRPVALPADQSPSLAAVVSAQQLPVLNIPASSVLPSAHRRSRSGGEGVPPSLFRVPAGLPLGSQTPQGRRRSSRDAGASPVGPEAV